MLKSFPQLRRQIITDFLWILHWATHIRTEFVFCHKFSNQFLVELNICFKSQMIGCFSVVFFLYFFFITICFCATKTKVINAFALSLNLTYHKAIIWIPCGFLYGFIIYVRVLWNKHYNFDANWVKALKWLSLPKIEFVSIGDML